VARNQSYEEYEKGLGVRIEEFKKYMEGLRNESEVFYEFWTKCVSNLRGEIDARSEFV
jgi:hypothetical protein